MDGRRYQVLVLDDATFRAWLIDPDRIEDLSAATREKCEATGQTIFMWSADPGRSSFLWLCPGCGDVRAGRMADEPVSGWENPRWVNSGTVEAPTLTPSLGCGAWLRGNCPAGHWWLRDGELVPA